MNHWSSTLIWIFYWIREALGMAYGFAIMKPFLLLLKAISNISKRPPEQGFLQNSQYVFYTEHWYDRLLLQIYKMLCKLGSLLSGIKPCWNAHGQFVRAKEENIFIGFKVNNAGASLGLKGPSSSDGTRGVDLMWTQFLKPVGLFYVDNKVRHADGAYDINCIWISGEHNGSGFTIGKVRTFEDLHAINNSTVIPVYFFRQPVFYVMLAQLLGLVGISSFMGLIEVLPKLKEWWAFASSVLKN